MIKMTIERDGQEPVVIESADAFIAYAVEAGPGGKLVGVPMFYGSYEELGRMMLGLGRAIHTRFFPEPLATLKHMTVSSSDKEGDTLK